MHCTQPFLKNQRFFKKSYNLSAGNTNDSKIFFNQLDNFINISAIRKNNNNIFIGDASYDSNNIRNKLKDFNLGNLVVSLRKKNLQFFFLSSIIQKKS